jgi:hypothetical protein
VYKEQVRLDKLYPVTTQHMADTIQDWVCNKMRWEKYHIEFARKICGRIGRTLGKNFKNKKKILIYKNGEGAGVLLHEIAHIKEYHHKPTFWIQLMSLIKMFETEFIPSMNLQPVQTKEVPVETLMPKEDVMFTNEQKLQYVMEILEEHIQKDSIKMRYIGKTLLDEGMNSKENIMEVIKRLHEKNIFVIREVR